MTITRRGFIHGTAAAALLAASGFSFAADTIKIGYVSPQTGPLAPFGEADKWVIEQMKDIVFAAREVIINTQHIVALFK